MKPAPLLVLVLALLALTVSAQSQAGKPESGTFAHSTQVIAVTTSDWNAVDGHLQRYERPSIDEPWHPVGEPISIVVGKNGLGWGVGLIPTDTPNVRTASDPVKHEGDGRGPAGIFALGAAFGDDPQPLPGLKLPYLQLTPSIECVDDATSKQYNRIVDRATVAPDWSSSEHMRDVGKAYRWGIVVGLNGAVANGQDNPPKPGAGSCVFLHIWNSRTEGTAGCTAMPLPQLETLMIWLDPARRPLLVQLPQEAYERLSDPWKLPKSPGVSRP